MKNSDVTRKTVDGVGNRVRLLLGLLCVGIGGLVAVFFVMKLTQSPNNELAASYANRGVLTNLSDIFLVPGFMFFAILAAYSIHELYKSYKTMNDPETYRNKSNRSARFGNVEGRKSRRLAKEQSRRAKKQGFGSDNKPVRPRRRTPLH